MTSFASGAFEHAPSGIAVVDLDGRFVNVNASLCRLLGYRRAELVGGFAQDATHPIDLDVGTELATQILRGEVATARISRRYVRRDGHVVHLVKHFAVIRDGAGEPVHFVVHYEERTEHELREQRFRALVMHTPVGIIELDAAARCTFVNPRVLALTGLTCEESLGDGWTRAIHCADIARVRGRFEAAAESSSELSTEFRFVSTNGSIAWVLLTAVPREADAPPTNGYIGTIMDVTERHLAEVVLRRSLDERGTLQQEIHHRVKNSLQVVASLLRLQSRRALEAGVRAALDDSERRVQSVALLHERLSHSDQLAGVDFGLYVRELVASLLRGHAGEGRPSVEVSCPELVLDLAVAMPCGLLVNELVANALKHAFVGRQAGTVGIRARRLDGQVELIVEDDGVGRPADVADAQLVRFLANQLDADLDVESTRGTRYRLRFAYL